jgi:hypothetical protein
MSGGTGNLRTLRNQSGTVGSRTLGSILATGSSAGAGSTRRVFAYYRQLNPNQMPFTEIFGLKRGQVPNYMQYI